MAAVIPFHHLLLSSDNVINLMRINLCLLNILKSKDIFLPVYGEKVPQSNSLKDSCFTESQKSNQSSLYVKRFVPNSSVTSMVKNYVLCTRVRSSIL